VATRLLPPDSFMGTLDPKERDAAMRAGSLYSKYARVVDRESAREMLHGKMASPVSAPTSDSVSTDRSTGAQWTGSAATMAKEILKSPLTRQIGREVVRGIFGMLKKNLR
jgi:hypothetical protein